METRIIYNTKSKAKTVEEFEPTKAELDQRVVAKAQQELEELRDANRITLHDKAKLAIIANKEFLALEEPTAKQSIEQVAKLTSQMNKLIRLVVQELDETD